MGSNFILSLHLRLDFFYYTKIPSEYHKMAPAFSLSLSDLPVTYPPKPLQNPKQKEIHLNWTKYH